MRFTTSINLYKNEKANVFKRKYSFFFFYIVALIFLEVHLSPILTCYSVGLDSNQNSWTPQKCASWGPWVCSCNNSAWLSGVYLIFFFFFNLSSVMTLQTDWRLQPVCTLQLEKSKTLQCVISVRGADRGADMASMCFKFIAHKQLFSDSACISKQAHTHTHTLDLGSDCFETYFLFMKDKQHKLDRGLRHMCFLL